MASTFPRTNRAASLLATLALALAAAERAEAQLFGFVYYGFPQCQLGTPNCTSTFTSFSFGVAPPPSGGPIGSGSAGAVQVWDEIDGLSGVAFDEASNRFYMLGEVNLFSLDRAQTSGFAPPATFIGSVTNAATGSLLEAQGLTFRSADGKLYASSGRTLYRLDVTPGSVRAVDVAIFGPGAEFDGLAYDERTDLFYATNNGPSYVPSRGGGAGTGLVEIDLSLGPTAADRRIAPLPYPSPAARATGLAIDPLGVLYLVRDRRGSIARYDVDTDLYLPGGPSNNALGTFPRGASGAAYAEVLRGDLGTVYCDAWPGSSSGMSTGVNSTGLVGELRAAGSPVLTDNAVALLTYRLPSGTAVLFLTSRTMGYSPNPGGSDGSLCLGGVIGRFNGPDQVRATDEGGRADLAIDLFALPQTSGTVAAIAGETWHFQAMYRDAQAGSATLNFTTAVEVQWN
ncbi:MAG: hypothetical protein AAGB93_03755 [Planctomycetota bacterium]